MHLDGGDCLFLPLRRVKTGIYTEKKRFTYPASLLRTMACGGRQASAGCVCATVQGACEAGRVQAVSGDTESRAHMVARRADSLRKLCNKNSEPPSWTRTSVQGRG